MGCETRSGLTWRSWEGTLRPLVFCLFGLLSRVSIHRQSSNWVILLLKTEVFPLQARQRTNWKQLGIYQDLPTKQGQLERWDPECIHSDHWSIIKPFSTTTGNGHFTFLFYWVEFLSADKAPTESSSGRWQRSCQCKPNSEVFDSNS